MAQQPTETDFAAMNENIIERMKVLEARKQQLIYQQSQLIEQSEAAAKGEVAKKDPAPRTTELTSDRADVGEQELFEPSIQSDASEAELFGSVHQVGDDLIFSDLDGILMDLATDDPP
jgi:hypothetical protein